MHVGIQPAQMSKYLAYLRSNHDFNMTVDILRLDHTPVRSVTNVTLDGQVNLQTGDAVARTASFSSFR